MRTGYEIDKFQRAYFVLPSFDALRDGFERADLAAIVGRRKGQPAARPGEAIGRQRPRLSVGQADPQTA